LFRKSRNPSLAVDRSVKEILSPGLFKFSQISYSELVNLDLLPEPYYITNIFVAFLEKKTGTNGYAVRWQLVLLNQDHVPPRHEFIKIWEEDVASYQEMAPNNFLISELMPDICDGENLDSWIVSNTLAEGRITLAGHVIARTASSGKVISSFAYPEAIAAELMLRFRDGVISRVLPIQSQIADLGQRLDESIKLVLQNHSSTEHIAAAMVSSFLPDLETITRMSKTRYPANVS